MRHMPEEADGARTDEPLRVIVADDDPLARRVVRDALEAGGIVVIAEAANGREAVELSLYYKPDVVLMDLVMPDVDGIQATRRILAREPDVEIVILTSSDDDDVGLVGLRAGATGIRPVRSRLTPREWEVLDLLCTGQSTDEIAATLVLSSETVRSHIKNLLRKLGVSSRQAAVKEARRMRADLAVSDESLDAIEIAAA